MKPELIQKRYRVLRTLGKGGMGEVFLVEDKLKKDRRVALKTIKPDAPDIDEFVDHFKAEFDSLRKLSHPNLAKVYDFGYDSEKGQYFFSSEYLEGTDLLNASKTLSPDQLYEILVQVCRALEYIHSHGIIHYDIKPQHILVETRANKLVSRIVDFGLAAEVQTKSGLPIRGTIAYLAPEVAKRDLVDGRADLYSLGATLYHVLSGKTPFGGKSPISTLRHHIEKLPEFPSNMNKSIPSPLRQITLKLLAKEPSERYQNANEVIAAINKLANKNFELETTDTRKSYILSPKFVGRERELKKLVERFAELKAGNLEKFFIVIAGEEGTGKSRLLREFKYHVQLSGTPCFTGETATGLNFLRDILRQTVSYFGAENPVVSKYAPYLSRFVPEVARGRKAKALAALDAREDKIRVFDNLARFILAVSEVEKFTLLIEDIDSIDSFFREFLEYLLRTAALSSESRKAIGMLLCATCVDLKEPFPRELTKKHSEQIAIRDFSIDETEALIDSMLRLGEQKAPFAQKVFSVTGGNPLFVEEVMKNLMEEGLVVKQEGIWLVETEKAVFPNTLSSTLSRRLSRHSRQALNVLHALAALNRTVPIRILSQVVEAKDISTDIAGLRKSQMIIRRRNGYELSQPYLGQMLLSKMSRKTLKLLHNRIGNSIEKAHASGIDEHIEEIAYHYLRGSEKKKAIEFGALAAEELRKSYANEAVIDCYRRMLLFLDKDESKKKFEISMKLGEMFELIGQYEKARSTYMPLLRLKSPGKLQQAETYKKIADILFLTGQYDKALQTCNKALTNLEKLKKSTRVLADIYNLIGNIDERKKNMVDAEVNLRKGLKIREKIGDSVAIADSLNNLGLLYTRIGDQTKATRCYQESLDLYKRIGDEGRIGTSLLNLGILFEREGRYAKAAKHFARSLAIQKKVGDKWRVMISMINLGCVYIPMGDYILALDCLEEGLKESREIDSSFGVVHCLANIGRAYLEIGDLDKAIECINNVVEYSKEGLPVPVEGQASLDLGTTCLRRGRLEEAENHLLAALEKSDEAEDRRLNVETLLKLADMHHVKNSPDKCREVCEKALGKATKIGALDLQAWANLALGKCYEVETKLQQAKTLLENSLKTGRKLRLPDLIQNASYELAGVYRQLGKAKKSRELNEMAINSVQKVAGKLDGQLKAAYLSAPIRNAIIEGTIQGKLPSKIETALPSVSKEKKKESFVTKKKRPKEAGIEADALTRDGIMLLGMVNRIINAGLDPDKMLNIALGTLIDITQAERGFIILIDEQGRFSHRVARNIQDEEIISADFSRNIVERVIKTGRSQLIDDASGKKQFQQFQSVIKLNLRSVMCVPVKKDSSVIGVIYLDNTSLTKQFGENDRTLVEAFAQKIAAPLRISLEHEKQARIIEQLQGQLQTKYQYENIVGKSKPMQDVFEVLDRVTPTDLNIYIYGDTGTGKELVAKAIHYNGPRKEKPFISVNCGAIPEPLLESELFGYVKGAFTGADKDKKGLFEVANGGTLFLDEIGNMSEAMQQKMLRVLQEKELRPIGSDELIKLDVRIISATNRDLMELVESKEFREDLYYRLRVAEIYLPPLRERREDISLLIDYFLEKYKKEKEIKKELEPAAIDLLLNYDWPGNVRELENMMQTLNLVEGSKITHESVLANLPVQAETVFSPDRLKRDNLMPLEELERDYIIKVLQIVDGNKSEAARILGIDRDTLRRKLKKYTASEPLP
ncbi:MAG: tetratricopeptide repeat protein [Planctomycetota bacterium]|nr:MAG: tetratricopeptide repeat protein [Planctomycetota bacterium]